MEAADIPESTGECSRNESGWTMYIGDDDSSESYHQVKENTDDDNGGDDSDDSLTSDASSGKGKFMAAGNKKSSAATKKQQQQKEEAKEFGKNNVKLVAREEDAVRDKSSRGLRRHHSTSFLQKK